MKEGIFCSKTFPMVHIGEMSDKKYTRTDLREATPKQGHFRGEYATRNRRKKPPHGP